jgi:hypothetical protein
MVGIGDINADNASEYIHIENCWLDKCYGAYKWCKRHSEQPLG